VPRVCGLLLGWTLSGEQRKTCKRRTHTGKMSQGNGREISSLCQGVQILRPKPQSPLGRKDKMKIDKRDKIFSLLVRQRAEWTCEACHKKYPENSAGLHCSHLVSRRYQSTRHHPLAAAAHCFACHQRLGGNPLEFAEWIRNHLGPEKTEYLLAMKNTLRKRTQPEKEDLYQQLKAEYARMMELRKQGKRGRIEFRAFDEAVLERREKAARRT